MNTVQILGNITRDPEVRYTQSGKTVATFTVAATNTYVDSATNETKEQTSFINWQIFETCRRIPVTIKGVYLKQGNDDKRKID